MPTTARYTLTEDRLAVRVSLPPAYPGTVTVDAVVLAGGRSSRLGGEPKAQLRIAGATLVEHAVAAASGCRQVVVVGDRMPGTLHARENPPFGGPGAGLAAGIRALDADRVLPPADRILVLACDVPNAARAVGVLLGSAFDGSDGLIAVDGEGRTQPLLALYSASALREAIDRPDLDGISMRSLLSDLRLETVAVPSGSTDDVDTWADVDRLGVERPAALNPSIERMA